MAYTTIDDPSAHFHIQLYSANGSTNAITNDANAGNIKPDLLWVKIRSHENGHSVFDTSRETSGESTLVIRTNNSNAEGDIAGDGMTSIDADGFTFNGNGAGGSVNEDGRNGMAWQWKANGGTRTTNTESGDNPGGGYQANTTAGFSIVDYTGTGAAGTMAHGLGAVPHVMIHKNRADARDWRFYHHIYGAEKYLDMNTTAAQGDASTPWNDTDPTSSVFTVGSDGGSNDDGDGIIAYLWTEIQGYSKFGIYVGNASADGPFVYTGFKPAWIMVKAVAIVEHWWNTDNKRNPHNVANKAMKVSDNSAESTSGYETDLLSNGFKIRATSGQTNSSTQPYLYMAFAEHPFVTSGGVPCTAR